MQRHQLKFLSNWLDDNNRKPLVIRGARQVGKSTLVELSAREYKKDLLNVNLERYPELSQVMLSKDPDQIIQEVEFLPNMGDINNNSLFAANDVDMAGWCQAT